MNITTDRHARAADVDELDDDRDAPTIDRRREAHAWSREVVTEAFLEGKLDAPR